MSNDNELDEILVWFMTPLRTDSMIGSTVRHLEAKKALLKWRDTHTQVYGGCTDCYGKGYATVRDGTIGYEDFGGDGFKSPITTKMKFCKCSRGEQLEALTQAEVERARANEAGNIYKMGLDLVMQRPASEIVVGGTDLDRLLKDLERKYGKDHIMHVYGDHNQATLKRKDSDE